ncbi:MAG TPA: AMP-binding protein [Actinomycetota bacterium]|nr:AMP-binding protein [Actinomycetota bacterium]
MQAYRRPPADLLHTGFMREARRHWGRLALADTTGRELSFGRALTASLALASVLARRTPGERTVGVLLPASVGGALANLALLSAGRVPVNLNFTIGPDAMEAAVAESGIRTIVTSRRFLERANVAGTPGMIFLEELGSAIGAGRRLLAFLEARLAPLGLLRRRYGGRGVTPDSLATVIFSSGSSGEPKGVMISHANVLANVDALGDVFSLYPEDRFIGVLPFFHAFGFTGTFWFPLLQGAGVVYHPNPMDAKTVGELAERYRATMVISTPTFCAAYLRRVTPEQFAHLRYVVVGAEKLRAPLACAFREKYGVWPLEGYGCTEMSPVVAINRPDVVLDGMTVEVGTKAGSVGRPIPGVRAKVVDLETGEGPLVGREGLLLVRGPNLMRGYLKQPERTAEAIRDGWYVTGDIATIDEDGFITITDRLSRFSKIGGEMVPHLKIEEAIDAVLGEGRSAVTAVPDAARGERLVAFYTGTDLTADELWERLRRTDLPRLWLPRPDCLFALEGIPTLGTGKVDLRALRVLAAERVRVADGG